MVGALLQALIFIVPTKRNFRVAFVVMSTSESSYDIWSNWLLSSLGIDPVTILQYRIRRCISSKLILDFDYWGGRFSWGFSSSLKNLLTPQTLCSHVLPISTYWHSKPVATTSYLHQLHKIILNYTVFFFDVCVGRREVKWRKTSSFTTANMTFTTFRNVTPYKVQR